MVPGDCSVPTERNQSAPRARMFGRWDSVSALLTDVGFRGEPWTSKRPFMYGGYRRGFASRPSMTSSIAFSSPNRYTSGPRTMVVCTWPIIPASTISTAARSSASIAAWCLCLMPMKACSAPTAIPAIVIPSRSEYGLFWSIQRSLNVPGSPSETLATTNLRSASAEATPPSLIAVGKPAPPRPRRPLARISAIAAVGPIRSRASSPNPPPAAR